MTKRLAKITIIFLLVATFVMTGLMLMWLNAVIDLFNTAELTETQQLTYYCIKHPQIEQVFEEPELEYLGNYKLTYYCACEICCGKSDGITATGTHATEGRTIAVDPKVIPYGSQVMISGHVYTAEDCGGSIKGNRIDVYVESHQYAKELGVDYADVYLLK